MGWLRNLFKPAPDRFIEMLIHQAEACVAGLEGLVAYTKSPGEEIAKSVQEAEERGDEERRILIDELNRTFVTPLDREDIFALSRALDDVLDYAFSTVDEMALFHVQPNAYLTRMVSLLNEAGKEMQAAMLRLTDHPHVANDHAVRAKALENRMESVYREALAALFQQPMRTVEDVVSLLKMREVYRHLSNAADRADAAANIVTDIVVKLT